MFGIVDSYLLIDGEGLLSRRATPPTSPPLTTQPSGAMPPHTRAPPPPRRPQTPRSYGRDLSRALAAVVGDISERGMLLLIPPVETALRRFPREACGILDELLLRLFAVAAGGGGGETDLVVAHCCACLGRVLLQAPEEFYGLCARAGAALPAGADPLLAFLDAWTDRADCLTNADRRKARDFFGVKEPPNRNAMPGWKRLC